MRYALAILCALALAVAECLYGGVMRPVFALPAFMLAGVAGMLCLSAIWSRGLPAPNSGAIASVLALAAWLVWRDLAATDVWLAGGYLRLTLGCLVVYLIFACAVTHPFPRLLFFGAVMALGLVQAALGIWQATHAHDAFPIPWMSEALRSWYVPKFLNRAHGFYLNANHLAWLLNTCAVISISLTCWGRWGIVAKVICAWMGIIFLAGTLLTASRGGLLALGASLAMFAFLSFAMVLRRLPVGKKNPVVLVLAGAFVAAVLFTLAYQGSAILQARYARLLDDSYREVTFDTVLRQFQLAPLLGTGPGTFMYQARRFRDVPKFYDDIFAHNDWAQIAADFGFPALALCALAMVIHLLAANRQLRDVILPRMRESGHAQSHALAILIASMSATVAFAVHSLFDFNMQVPANALLAAAMFGMLSNAGITGRASVMGSGFRVGGCTVAFGAGAWLLGAAWTALPGEYFWLRAENAMLKGEWKDATSQASAGLTIDPAHPHLQRIQGQFLLESLLGEAPIDRRDHVFAAAVKFFSGSVKASPCDWTNYLLMAEALRQAGRLEGAEAAAITAIEWNPDWGNTYTVLAEIHVSRGRLKEARTLALLGGRLPGSVPGSQRTREIDNMIRVLEGKLPLPPRQISK